MSVECKSIDSVDLRTLERAILKEAAGCSFEDEKALIYTTYDVVLHATALAKKLLGVWGVEIGNDPRQSARYALDREARFNYERELAKLVRDGNEHYATQVKQLQKRRDDFDRADAAYDADAWHKVITLEDRIKRRAYALSRCWAPATRNYVALVNVNISDLVPVAVMEVEVRQGNPSGGVPWDGTIQATDVGLYVVSQAKWPQVRSNQRPGTHPLDQELELVR